MKLAMPLILLTAFSACTRQPEPPVPAPEAEIWSARAGEGEPLSGEEGITVEVAARVKAVDLKKRQLTLEEADGRQTTIRVGPEVTRLSEIRPGDMIEAEFTESLAFEVRPPTADELRSPTSVTTAVAKAGPGETPAGGMADMLRAVLKVTGVNRKAGTITVKGPGGGVYTMRARDPQNLKRVKVGDTVVMTYKEAVAVELEPARR